MNDQIQSIISERQISCKVGGTSIKIEIIQFKIGFCIERCEMMDGQANLFMNVLCANADELAEYLRKDPYYLYFAQQLESIILKF